MRASLVGWDGHKGGRSDGGNERDDWWVWGGAAGGTAKDNSTKRDRKGKEKGKERLYADRYNVVGYVDL